MKKSLLLATIIGASFSVNAQDYSLDKAHSSLAFVVTHLKTSEMPGDFKSFDIKLTSSKEDFSDAVIELTIDANSINTGNEGRDKHLTSADFLNAEKNPTITFKSKTVTKTKGNVYKITGEFTLNGVTKTIELSAINKGKTNNPFAKKDVYVWKVTGKIKRSDFGVGKDMPNDVVGDIILLNANLEFVK